MISAINSLNIGKYQQKSQKSSGFGSKSLVMAPPENFQTVVKDFLHIGAYIQKYEELQFLVWEKGVRNVLSFLNPFSELLKNEKKFIIQHNKSYPDYKITFNSLPWGVHRDIYEPGGGLTFDCLQNPLVKTINSLKDPVYMHCIAGLHMSWSAAELIQKAIGQGKINLKI